MSSRVLVVDDSKVIRQLIRVNLELDGFEVQVAADGAQCLEIVHQLCPDVITLDVAMPRLDGPRTAELLRQDPRTCHIPLVLVSGSVAGCDRSRFDAVLSKPFDPLELVRTVRRLAHGDAGRSGCPASRSVTGGADSVLGHS
ncbi:response regulator [Streptomyces sp. P38-E01]|uniref:Response regulator n=1 Tax=Streptomyces tardus TaxID=2780544 RepID=A0A949N320_9ACTN|nr:response regulator [Streptomyces tardus]MBU7596389.1 response regulator [Streptomyces tardus]